jgi:hypothetical protein
MLMNSNTAVRSIGLPCNQLGPWPHGPSHCMTHGPLAQLGKIMIVKKFVHGCTQCTYMNALKFRLGLDQLNQIFYAIK